MPQHLTYICQAHFQRAISHKMVAREHFFLLGKTKRGMWKELDKYLGMCIITSGPLSLCLGDGSNNFLCSFLNESGRMMLRNILMWLLVNSLHPQQTKNCSRAKEEIEKDNLTPNTEVHSQRGIKTQYDLRASTRRTQDDWAAGMLPSILLRSLCSDPLVRKRCPSLFTPRTPPPKLLGKEHLGFA